MKKMLVILALAGAGLVAGCGQGEQTASADVDPQVAALIETRQGHLDGFGEANRNMNNALNAAQPDIEVIRTNLQSIMAVAPDLTSWFPEGSGPESGARTDARPEIWERRAEFEARHADLLAGLQQFSATVESGDIAAIRAGLPVLGETCRGCHMPFRVMN